MHNVIYLVILCFFTNSFAQSKIKFEKEEHDFGEISEDGGPVEFTFRFVNTGESSIKIHGVETSCGCTTPGWSKEEIVPGDSGFVKARYNPKNRPGKFRKSLRVTTSNEASEKTLYITGFVKPKPKSPEEEYPVVFGSLSLKTRTLTMGRVTTEKVMNKAFDVYNDTDTVVSLPAGILSPDYIKFSLTPASLNPKEYGALLVSYDPIAKNDYGYVSDNISIAGQDHDLSVIATIEEYFPEMTARELDVAPKLGISSRVFDFGNVYAGSQVETSFELRNTGHEKLELRAIKSNCGCITYEVGNKSIKKGKSQELKVRLDTSGMRGNQYKSISIFSNDPVNPTQIITLKGKVQAE